MSRCTLSASGAGTDKICSSAMETIAVIRILLIARNLGAITVLREKTPGNTVQFLGVTVSFTKTNHNYF